MCKRNSHLYENELTVYMYFMFLCRFPVPVDLKKTNLKKEIDRVLQCSLMSLGHGPCRYSMFPTEYIPFEFATSSFFVILPLSCF